MKRMKQLYAWLCCLSLLALTNCVEEYNVNLGETAPILVVDGNILSDTIVVFTLTRSFGLNEEVEDLADYQINDATLRVSGSKGNHWEARSIGKGEYSVTIGKLQPDEEYSVEIAWKDEMYASIPQRPLLSTAIDELTFKQDTIANTTSILLSVTADQAETEYYLWDYEEVWEVQSEYACRAVYESSQGQVVTYAQPPYDQGWIHTGAEIILIGSTEGKEGNRLKDKEILNFSSSNSRLGVYYSMLFTQRNVTKGEYEYYQCRQRMDYEMGGLFTPQPTELPTNIECTSNPQNQVIGYVGCNLNIAQQRLYIANKDVEYTYEHYCGTLSPNAASSMGNNVLFLSGYQICLASPDGMYYWGPIECVDVRERGASVDESLRPSWWPIPIRVVTEK